MSSPVTEYHEEDALGKAYDARLMRRLLRYVRPYGWLVLSSLSLLAVEGVLQLVGPLLTQRVIDVALPAGDVAAAARMALILAGALTLSFGASYAETLLTSLLGQNVMRDLRHELFAHLQQLPVAFFDRNPVGRLITRVTSDVESLNELFTAGVVSGMGDLFTLLAISILMVVTDWRLAIASFAVIPLVWMTSTLFQRAVRGAYREIRTRLARINAYLQEHITGMRIVQLFGREREEAARFDALNRHHLDAHLRSIRFYALYFPAIEILTTVALASLIVAGARRVEIGALTVGTVAAFLQLVRRFFDPLQDLSDKYNMLQQAMAASERIFKLLDTPVAPAGVPLPERRTTRASTLLEDAALVPPQRQLSRRVTVEFHDVWFAYDIAHVARAGSTDEHLREWILKGVSFRAQPGQTIALVGHTGAGKTTIVNLLLRFYDPQRGRITVNGTDIREMPVGELRSLIGYVQQDIFLFAGDIASNIRLSNPLMDDEVAVAAARVGADRIIAGCLTGTRTCSGNAAHRSVSVSGSCSRSLARSPPIRRCWFWTRRRAQWTARSRRRSSAPWRY